MHLLKLNKNSTNLNDDTNLLFQLELVYSYAGLEFKIIREYEATVY